MNEPPVLPDSRLKLERRPKWLDWKISTAVLEDLGVTYRQTGESLLSLIMTLSRWVEVQTGTDIHPIDPLDRVKRCRVCQCTEHNCSGCYAIVGRTCTWHPDDPTVCTACVKPKGGGA